MTATHTLAFEIGVEEIPAFDLDSATKQLREMVPEAFSSARIPFGSIEIYSSPRRLIVLAREVADTTEALTQVHKGPAARIAFDQEGNPTKAAIGFARGKNASVEDLERRDVDGIEYVFVVQNIPAVRVSELLPEILHGFIESIKWPRSQRWASYRDTFVRPVRWICALLDDEIIPLSYAGAQSDRFTWGHRVLAPGKHEVSQASELLNVVRGAFVVPSQDEREAIIRKGVEAIEAETGYRADLPAKTLLEVVNLSEYPQPLMGTFDNEFLLVPEEIIVDAMLMHQRYFPLYDADGKLSNRFIITSNGDPQAASTIIDGNERVVRARLDDAKFFYEEDLKKPLESYVDELDAVVFQESLGTVRDKVKRIVYIAQHLAEDAHLGSQDAADVVRAAQLCKADLVTNAVVEFTSVQGVMGGYYALASGETEQVAEAIRDHYRPRFAGDEPPASLVGKLVAFADKLDSVCGLIAVGQGPTGSSDPFALRRSAIGMVGMLQEGLPVSLQAAISSALDALVEGGVQFDRIQAEKDVTEFFVTRTKVMLRDAQASPDAIDAVLAAGVVEPADITLRTHALEQARSQAPETMNNLAIAFARAHNLRDASLGIEVDQSLLEPEEACLLEAITSASDHIAEAMQAGDFARALDALAHLREPIDSFFEAVMVMSDDQAIRENRLRLLNRFVDVFTGIADFSLLA